MDIKKEIVLESADVQDNGVIITFSDGKFAFYSAALLYSIFPQAEELHGTAEDAEEDGGTATSR